MKSERQAFTLIELLVVIAIIAILSVVVVLTLNLAQLLAQSRDSNRVSDLATVQEALQVYTTDQTSGTLGSSSIVYVSIPDLTATSTAGDQCQGLGLPALSAGNTYHCAASSTFKTVNGAGWIPINFSSASFGSSIASLPADPVNQTSSNLYYTYATNGTQFQLTAHFESQKYIPTEANSGGSDPAMYTAGTNLALAPYVGGMVGWWPLNENGGTLANDGSGNNATGSYLGAITWVNGKPSQAILITSTSSYAKINSSINMGTTWTISSWSETTLTVEMPIVSNRGSGGSVYYGMTGGHPFLYEAECSPNILNGPIAVHDGNFHLLTLVRTPSLESWYVDGAFISSQAISSCNAQNAKITIGAGDSNPEYFAGAIDDVRIYNRALSPSEIAAIYAAGK